MSIGEGGGISKRLCNFRAVGAYIENIRNT